MTAVVLQVEDPVAKQLTDVLSSDGAGCRLGKNPLLPGGAIGVGHDERPHGVTADKVLRLVKRIKDGAPALGDYAENLVEEAVRRGYLPPAPDSSEMA